MVYMTKQMKLYDETINTIQVSLLNLQSQKQDIDAKIKLLEDRLADFSSKLEIEINIRKERSKKVNSVELRDYNRRAQASWRARHPERAKELARQAYLKRKERIKSGEIQL